MFADSSDKDDDDGSDIDHTHKQNEQQATEKEIEQKEQVHYDSEEDIEQHEQVPFPSEEEIEQEPPDQLQGLLDLRIGDLCSHICKNDKPSHVLCMALWVMPTSNLLLLQLEMKKRFERADEWLSDLGTDDTRQLLTFANYITASISGS